MVNRKAILESIYSEIDAIYADLPETNCQRKCQSYCRVIKMNGVELLRIVERVGHDPDFLDANRCPMLTDAGDCGIYDIRPLICRLFGSVRALQCPHGCTPDGLVSDAQVLQIFSRLETLTQRIKGARHVR